MTKEQRDAMAELENEIKSADEHGNIIIRISRPAAGIIRQMVKEQQETKERIQLQLLQQPQ